MENGRVIASDPLDGVFYQLAQIRIAGSPARTVNITWKKRDSRRACCSEHCSVLRCPWRAWIDHFWWKCWIPRNNAQDEWSLGLYGNVGFGSRQQRRAIETFKNRMLRFNAGVSVSLRSNDLTCHMSAEHIGQLKVGTWFAQLVVAGRFKRSEKRS
jgi:hypothetical protein